MQSPPSPISRWHHVFLPYVWLLLLTTAVYFLATYLLIFRFHWLTVSENWIRVYVPAIIATLLMGVFLRPRLRIFQFRPSGNGALAHYVISGLTLLAAMALASLLAQMLTRELRHVSRPSAILHDPAPVSAYQFAAATTNLRHRSTVYAFHDNPKRDDDLTFYTVTPLLDDSAAPNLGLYLVAMDNYPLHRPTQAELDSLIPALGREVEQRRNDPGWTQFVYVDTVGQTETRPHLLRAARLLNPAHSRILLLEPAQHPFTNDTADLFIALLWTMAAGLGLLAFVLRKPALRPTEATGNA